MEDNELEEGEACYYQDDCNYDPDVALSYIDVKLQDVLGHFQKEFEGGVSAENLGAKFGGYGSFLPTHQRSPSVLLQPKTPAIFQNNSTQKSPNEGTAEHMRRMAASSANAALPLNLTSASNNVPCTSAALAVDIADKRETSVTVMKGSGEDFPFKKESAVKNVSHGDQKTLKLRIKMGSDSVRRRKNTAIYSGLGLENSPSPSLEDSPDTSQEFSLDSEHTSPQSPLSMIRAMTSHQIPGDSLLTPLPHALLQLPDKEDKPSANDDKGRKIKTEIQEALSTNKNDSKLGKDLQGQKEKKGRISEKNRKYTETKKETDHEIVRNTTNNLKKDVEFETRTSRESGSNILKLPTKSFSKDSHQGRPKGEIVGDSVKESLKGCDLSKEVAKATSKGKVFSSDLARDEHKEADGNRDLARVSKAESGLMSVSGKQTCKERGPVQEKEARKASGHKDPVADVRKMDKEAAKDCKNIDSLKDSTGYKERNELKDATKETSKEKVSDKVVTYEMVGTEKEHGKEHASMNKRNQKDMYRNINSCKEASKEKSKYFARETSKDQRKDTHAKDNLTSEVFNEGIKGHKESSKAYVKDYHKDCVKDVGQEQAGNRKDSVDIYRKDNTKESKFGHLEKGSSRMCERGRENEHGITKVSTSKNLEHSSTNEPHPSNAVVAQPLPAGVMGAHAGLAPSAPVVINDNWVLCDACEKWRLLPCGVDPLSLPKKWLCHMLDWLPEMNRCDVSEDETTQALYAMYGVLPGQSQVDTNKGQLQLPGAPVSAPVLGIKQAEPIQEGKTPKLSTVISNSKKGQAHKSVPIGSTNLSGSLIRKNKHSSVKSKSLNDVVQQPPEQMPGSIGVPNQAVKVNDAVIERHKHKQKEKWKLRQYSSDEVGHATEHGNTLTLKTKRKREGSELDGHKDAKKGKVEDALGTSGDFLLGTDSIDRVGSFRNVGTPVKLSSGKAKKFEGNASPKREFNHETREDLQRPDKKFKDQLQASIETDSRGANSGFDTARFDRKDFSTKKRKIKEWKESKASQEGCPEGHMLDGRVMMKEEESETENRREKKMRTSEEGKESSASKADDKNAKKGKVARILLSSNRDVLSNGMEEQSRGDFEKEHESGQSQGRGVAQRVSHGLDTLKRDLGYRQQFVAATSSSSKVSCSLKNLTNFQEARGSPVESVSSSPLRISKVEKIASARRNSGVDDLMDAGFPCTISPRRCSDGEGGMQSDHSRPSRRRKSSCVEQPGSHESCRGVQSTVLHSGRTIGDNHDRDGGQFSDVKAKAEKFRKKLDTGSTDATHFVTEYGNINLVNGVNAAEQQDICFNERREKELSQEKSKDCYNADGFLERRGSRVKSNRDQGGGGEKNSAHDKGKEKLHDCIHDGHEECYIGVKNAGREQHEQHPEGNVHSPYHEVSRDVKETFDYKCSYKADKDQRNDMDLNKHDLGLKKSGEGRKGIQLKRGMDGNTGAPPLDLHVKQNTNYISRHGKAGAVPWRDGKANLQQTSQQAPSCGGERASNQSFSDRNIQSGTASGRGKYQAIPCSGEELELQGHASGAGSMLNKGTQLERLAVDASNNEFSRVPIEANKADNSHGALSSGLKLPASNGLVGRDPDGAATSPIRKEHGQAAANAMKEAKDLKHSADRLKNTGGSEHESTGLYFRAALKFLHGASLLEPCNAENAKHGETTKSMTVYTDTARLCEFCAVAYERNKDMAAAALAYKCMGVAHMRVVVSKNVCLSRDRHELQAAVQMILPGESPSSSASDVDNLNNHALVDKGSSVNPVKAVGSPHVAGNHVIVARHRPHFLRILQFTQDVNAAIEAFRKSESAFAAANSSLDDANYGAEGISAVKRVIDFSFHDIDGLLRLVRLAMEAIYH